MPQETDEIKGICRSPCLQPLQALSRVHERPNPLRWLWEEAEMLIHTFGDSGGCGSTVTASQGPSFTPHTQMRVAVVFFGTVGTEVAAAREVNGDRGSPSLVRGAFNSFRQHVLAHNPETAFSFFCHSWSPSLGELIDSLYVPVWSQHEQESLRDVPSSRSAALSIRRGHEAIRRHELTAGRRYSLVWVMRLDLAFVEPMRLAALPTAQLWLLDACCGFQPKPLLPPPSNSRHTIEMARACGGGGWLMDTCRVSRFIYTYLGGETECAACSLEILHARTRRLQ